MIHYRHLEATKNDSKLRDFYFSIYFFKHLENMNLKVIYRVMTVKRSKLHKNYNKNIFLSVGNGPERDCQEQK